MLRRPRAVFAIILLFLLTAPLTGLAQNPANVPPPSSWVPQGFEVLGQRAAFHTDFTFDRSMLQVAGYFVGDSDPAVRSAIAKLNGISVHSYHFAAPGLYDPAQLDAIRRQYEASGWRHLVAAHGKGDPYSGGKTDLWINFAHMNVTGMMVLISTPKDLNLIALNGDISTVDLLHLRGHFGIPRFSGDQFVPPGSEATTQPRQPYIAPMPDAAMPEQPSQGPQQYPSPEQNPGGVGVGVGAGSPAVDAAPPPPTPPGF